MAELNTVARPYTKAVFEYARDAGTIDTWYTSLQDAAQVVSDEVMISILGNPALTSEQKAAAVITVLKDLDESGKNFISLLAENNRLALIPEIAVQYEQLKANQQSTVEIDVTTAYELDEQQQQNLTQALSAKLDRDVSLSSTVDQSILGGLVIRTQDLVIDGSVRAKIAKLAEVLNS